MSDHELLSAMSDLLDRKLEAGLQPIKEDVQGLKEDVRGLKEDVRGLKENVRGLKEDVRGLKEDVWGLKEDVQGLKEDVRGLKKDVQNLDHRMTKMEVHIENVTDKNIAHLIEVFEPAAKKYTEKAAEIEAMQEDIVVMKGAIRKHSDILQKIS